MEGPRSSHWHPPQVPPFPRGDECLPTAGTLPGRICAPTPRRDPQLLARETGNVIADMNDRRGPRRDGEESVEIRHTERLGGRHIEAETRVIEGARGNPPKPQLNGM